MIINAFTEYAGFWRRLAATVLDTLWIGTLVFCLLVLRYGNEVLNVLNDLFTSDYLVLLEEFGWPVILINDLLPALIVLFFWMTYQATPGKLLYDCDVVDARTGHPPTLGQAILRYLGYFISALPLGLGFLWIIWDKRKQGWHDKIAGTVVIMHDESKVPLPKLEKV